jgi:hypothetical protein
MNPTNTQISRPVIGLYLGLLAFHFAHVLEEIHGRFWIMNKIYGPGWFMAVNWLLFCIPVVFFYFMLAGKRWAYYCGIIYAGLMTLNGLGHNLAVIITGRYYDGFAGNYTGIAFIIIGPPLIYHLRKLWRK